jgi:hypothetical protein
MEPSMQARKLLHAGRAAEAIRYLDQHLRQGWSQGNPGSELHLALADALYQERRIAEALQHYGIALSLDGAGEEDPGAGARWMCCMLLGRYEEAWRESDAVLARRKRSGASTEHLPRYQQLLWDGTPLADRRVLVRCWRGLGDSLLVLRFIPHLRQAGCRVILEIQPELLRLARNLGAEEVVAVDGRPLDSGSFDVELESMELPYALRVSPEQVAAGSCPYLHVPSDARRGQLPEGWANGEYRVGIAWAAGVWKSQRSVPMRELVERLASVQGIVLISLQRGEGKTELNHAQLRAPVLDAEFPGEDAADTAALMEQLDLVISVDTMVGHLAGALGRPVWTLLHSHADWRWMLQREDSPWYPTMRLFRQPEPGNWGAVLDRVQEELNQIVQPSILHQGRSSAAMRTRHEQELPPGTDPQADPREEHLHAGRTGSRTT